MAWGKIIGGALGGLLGGPIGAGIGIAIGAGVDEADEEHEGDRGDAARTDSKSLRLEQHGNVLWVSVAVPLPPQADGALVRLGYQDQCLSSYLPVFQNEDDEFELVRPITPQGLSFDIPLQALTLPRNQPWAISVLVGIFKGDEALGVLAAGTNVSIGMQPWRFMDWMAPAVDILCHYALQSGRWTSEKIQRIKATFGEFIELTSEEAEALRDRLKLSPRPTLVASIESYHRRFGEEDFSVLLLRCVADLLRFSGGTEDRVTMELASLGRQLRLDADQVREALGSGQSSRGSGGSGAGNGSSTSDKPWAYGILGIAAGSNADSIQKAWRKKISELHPDKYTSLPDVVQNLIKEKAQELNRARDILLGS